MAISWNGAVALVNKIATDVPSIKSMLDALAKMEFSDITNLPAKVKRIATVTGGKQIQEYESNTWVTVGKLIHDVDTLDGKHAATGTTADTIPVRDANGKLPGDITGNAATASQAGDLKEGYTVPVSKGGTGASTAAGARINLGINLGTTSAPGLVRPDGETIRVDDSGQISVKITDSVTVTDSKTVASATAVKIAYDRGSAGVAAADNALTVANGKLPLAGGTITGPIVSSSMGILKRSRNDSYLTISGGNDWHTPGGAELTLFGHDYPEDPGLFRLGASGTGLLEGRPDGMLRWNGSPVVTATQKTNFRRQGVSGMPNLLWGGTHADGNNYDLYYPDQLTVGYAVRAAHLSENGNFNSTPCKFMWNGELETAMLAAFNSDGSQLHPVAMNRVSVGYANIAATTPNAIPIQNGTVIPPGGTWLLMRLHNGWLGGAYVAGGTVVNNANSGGFVIRNS